MMDTIMGVIIVRQMDVLLHKSQEDIIFISVQL